MEVSWKVGFPLYWYDNWNIRKTKLRPIQKHDVIYVISNEGYLNCWRDQEDQLQMLPKGSDFEQVTIHHQIN